MKVRSVVVATVLVAVSSIALAGCTNAPVKHHHASQHVVGGNETPLVDPILELTDSSSPMFVANSIVPNIEVQGTGPQSYQIARPSDPKAEIQFVLSCAPAAHFTLTMGGGFSAACGREGSDMGAIPVSQTPGTGPLTVKLEIPAGVHFWIVGIPYKAPNG